MRAREFDLDALAALPLANLFCVNCMIKLAFRLIFLLTLCINESMGNGTFFTHIIEELLRQESTSQQTLTIDQYLKVHVPRRVLARFDLSRDVWSFWNPTYNVLVFVFEKNKKGAMRSDETHPGVINASDLFALHEGEMFLGKLPAKLRFVIQPARVLAGIEGYGGGGDEAIIVILPEGQLAGSAAG